MSSKRPQWHVITGGPSSGKTTLLAELEKRGHLTVPEAARDVIDEALAAGISVEELRKDEQDFQHKVAERKAQIEAKLSPNKTTFIDRGMHDTLAYLRAYDFTVNEQIHKLLSEATYKTVFLLEPLTHYEKDYARTEDETFSKNLVKLLVNAYQEFGMKVISVPPFSVKERADFIIDHIKGDAAGE